MTTADTLAATLREQLDALGRTPDQIATALERAGITGRIVRGRCCPITEYLAAHVPAGYGVSTGCNYVRLIRVDAEGEETESLFTVPTSLPVQQFVFRFDDEQYPNLIRS